MSMGYFHQRFPGMTPVSGPPNLYSINGVGFAMYGHRDFDSASGTYVATHFLCFLFVPIFAVGAYRVADAHPGWYFLGKVPLSNLTRGWNCLLVAAMLFGGASIWWSLHASRPETIAAHSVADGDRLAADGKIGKAARKYQQVAMNKEAPVAAADAQQKLTSLFLEPLDNAEASELVEATVVGIDAFKINGEPKNIFDVALGQAKVRADHDDKTAWKLLDLIAPIAPPGDQDVDRTKKPILQRVLAKEPDNLDALSGLAVVYESEKQFDRCEKLLTPHRANLGDREGARILGQILLNKGQFDDALPLLQGYADERLKRLHAQEKNFIAVWKRVDERIFAELKTGKVPGFDLKRLGEIQADPNAQVIVNEYMNQQLKNDPEIKRAEEALRSASRVVPVAIDLGIALLRRGQAMPDPDARRKELEKAEQAFLSIKGVAGERIDFKLSLGQVYYWLGKAQDGRKLFDEYLQANNRSGQSLIGVANALHDVGSNAEARTLAEEAYDKEPNGRLKDSIAELRAVVPLDIDDRIAWLTRIHTPSRGIKAELCSARGKKALQENREDEAQKQFREAIEHYASLQEHSSTLNNCTLACFALYHCTGDVKDLERGTAQIEKALTLQPSDPIVLRNAADALLANSLRGIIGNALDWQTLRANGSLELLDYLYNDPAKKEHYRRLVRQHEGVTKAAAYYERLLVLSPRTAYNYGMLHSLHYSLQDAKALRQLQDRVASAELDHAEAMRRAKEVRDGAKAEQRIKEIEHGIAADDKLIAEARKRGGATLAIALGRRVHDKIALQALGVPIDTDELVAAAEEACKTAPSYGATDVLRDALLARAHGQLIQQDAAYADLAKKNQRWLRPAYVIAIALGKEGATQKACLENADIRRAQGLIKTQADAYDSDFSPWTWAMLRHAEPAWASAQAKQWQQNELSQSSRTISGRLSPPSAGEAYLQYWGLLMQGKDAEAALGRAVDQGVVMPK